ncbi:MAG: hypothetical protein LBJ17_09320 [Dysgonamonadaceae bacterium]|nr:hypothetical protein [Dysgonamonadaceae bacterium]
MKIYIDPRSTVNYSSFYIKGLYDFFGKSSVRFSARHFSGLKDIDMLMAFVTVENNKSVRYIIDCRDQSDVIVDAYNWADKYAKVNLNRKTTVLPADVSDKMVHIPPSFAVKIWNPAELAFNLSVNFIKAGIISRRHDKNIHLRPARYIRNYLSLLKRQKIKSYESAAGGEIPGYVFFVSTWWAGTKDTNEFRYRYIHSLKNNAEINFHGGFFVGNDTPKPEEIEEDLLYYRFISNSRYLKNIKKSGIVFNTPAVHNCHGWKLGEFLCLGKAIISTSLVNDLPEPLEHGKNIYFVKNSEDIPAAVNTLMNDSELRKRLGTNARQYYERLASPFKVIERIINKDI